MLYLGIDQHARQITISLRNDGGDVVLARQVSTRPEKIHAFFEKLTRERLSEGESFIAVLEVCGFNDWLIRESTISPNQKETPERESLGCSILVATGGLRSLPVDPTRTEPWMPHSADRHDPLNGVDFR